MLYDFVKMQGCGNDYIYFDCRERPFPQPEKNAVRLADRRFGVGGDGIILICPSEVADARMRIFNIDGSEGKMCGNGSRCVAKYLYERGGVRKDTILLETGAGIKAMHIEAGGGRVCSVAVEMGKAEFSAERVPVVTPLPQVVDEPMEFGGKEYRVTCLSMGNPHCVTFADAPFALCLPEIGPAFEKSPLFPEGVNTEFVRVIARDEIEMRVWERGSGETLACGTGACAAVAAACVCGHCDEGKPVLVNLRGGRLVITYSEEGVLMEGGAEFVFDGKVEI